MSELILRQAGTGMSMARLAPANDHVARATTGSDVAFELVDTLDRFHALEDGWNALFDAVASPMQVFQSYAWCWHWCRHYLPQRGRRGPQLAVVAGRIDGRLVLVMPLVVERRAGLRELCWLGEPVSQYGDVLATETARSPEVLARAWRFAAAGTRADVANLRKVRADSFAASMLRQAGTSVTAVEEAPWIDLSKAATFDEFDESLPGKGRRKNRRRQMRRLEERGKVEFECHHGTEDAARLADYAIRLKRVWLRDRDYISPALVDDRFAAFFADVAHGQGKPAGVKVLAVRSHAEVAALDIVIDCKGARFLHIAVFVGKFEKTGAGAILLEHAIMRCFGEGIRIFDLLAPKHEYKLDYTEQTTAIEDHALALSLKGRAWLSGFLAFRRRLKAAVETMPAPMRRGVAALLAIARRRRP